MNRIFSAAFVLVLVSLCFSFSQVSVVSLTVNELTAISSPTGSVDFGAVTSPATLTAQNVIIQNDGNLNAAIDFWGDKDGTGLLASSSQFKFSVSDEEPGSAGVSTSLMPVPKNSQTLTNALGYVDAADSLRLKLVIDIPANTSPGKRTATLFVKARSESDSVVLPIPLSFEVVSASMPGLNASSDTLVATLSSDISGSCATDSYRAIVTTDGSPVSGASIRITSAVTGSEVSKGTTGADGSYQFSAPVVGTYRFYATKPGFANSITLFTVTDCPGCRVFSSVGGSCDSSRVCCAVGKCISGICKECESNSGCSGGLVCHNSKCSSCAIDSQCDSGKTCSSGTCVGKPSCAKSADCEIGLICVSGACTKCTVSLECGDGKLCSNGKCIANPIRVIVPSTAPAIGEKIAILVVDSEQKPVAGAVVSVNDAIYTTDSSGKAIVSVTSTQSIVKATKSGYPSAQTTLASVSPSAPSVSNVQSNAQTVSASSSGSGFNFTALIIPVVVIIALAIIGFLVFSKFSKKPPASGDPHSSDLRMHAPQTPSHLHPHIGHEHTHKP